MDAAATGSVLNTSGSGGSERSEDSGGGGGIFEYSGWVYHLGLNSIGHEYCHLRFLFIRGKYVSMYKRDPHENPGLKPIRQGVVGPTLMVEELGRRKINNGDLYVLRFYNRLDETKKGEGFRTHLKHLVAQAKPMPEWERIGPTPCVLTKRVPNPPAYN